LRRAAVRGESTANAQPARVYGTRKRTTRRSGAGNEAGAREPSWITNALASCATPRVQYRVRGWAARLRAVAAKRRDDHVAADPRRGEWAAPQLSALATQRLEHDESTRREPRRSESAAHDRLDDAVEHPEELDLQRAAGRGGALSHRAPADPGR